MSGLVAVVALVVVAAVMSTTWFWRLVRLATRDKTPIGARRSLTGPRLVYPMETRHGR